MNGYDGEEYPAVVVKRGVENAADGGQTLAVELQAHAGFLPRHCGRVSAHVVGLSDFHQGIVQRDEHVVGALGGAVPGEIGVYLLQQVEDDAARLCVVKHAASAHACGAVDAQSR